MWQQFLIDYFNFTKKERWGITILISIIIVLILLPIFYPYFIKEKVIEYTQFENEIARLNIDSTGKKGYAKSFENDYYNDYSLSEKRKQPVGAEAFFFDPNTATVSEWVRLGIREKTAETIQKYISKGGKFYQPEDIKKIWGLRPADAQRLIPYVRIKNSVKDYPQFEKRESSKNIYAYVPKPINKVNINLADTAEYISLPGIGSKLSQRIIAYREKLGGFYSIDQVAETYFLPDSTFQKIKPYLILNDDQIKKININTATVDEMKSHPYIKFYLANAIFQYRKQHGNFTSVETVKKIMIVTEEMYNKVAPYLSVE